MSPKKLTEALIGFILLMPLSFPCMAATLNYSGDTTGEPTWTRPIENGNLPPTDLSDFGTDVNYQSQPFYVDTGGSYNFLSLAISPANWDNYLFLYQTSFDPLDALTNVVIGNDDFPSTGRAGFNSVSLTANTQYYLVTTGLADVYFGTYNDSITGLGNITAGLIPVPFDFSPTLGLIILGFSWQTQKWALRKQKEKSLKIPQVPFENISLMQG